MLTNSHHLNHPPNRSLPIANELLTWWSANSVDRCDERLPRQFDLARVLLRCAKPVDITSPRWRLTDSSVRFWRAMCFAFELCMQMKYCPPMEANHSLLHTFQWFCTTIGGGNLSDFGTFLFVLFSFALLNYFIVVLFPWFLYFRV